MNSTIMGQRKRCDPKYWDCKLENEFCSPRRWENTTAKEWVYAVIAEEAITDMGTMDP